MTATATRTRRRTAQGPWNVENVREKLGEEGRPVTKNAAFIERCIVVLYGFQTPTEQDMETTAQHNGEGFNATDAPFLSSLAKQIERSNRLPGTRLSPRQLLTGRDRLLKYAGQLARYANRRLANG